MATFRGKDGIVKLGANAVAEIKNWSIEQTADTEEDTAMGDDWRTHKGGLKSWTASIEAHWDDTDANGQEALLIGADLALTFYPESDTTGDYEYAGNAIVTAVGADVPMDDIVSRSFTVQGNGALAIGTAA